MISLTLPREHMVQMKLAGGPVPQRHLDAVDRPGPAWLFLEYTWEELVEMYAWFRHKAGDPQFERSAEHTRVVLRHSGVCEECGVRLVPAPARRRPPTWVCPACGR